MEQTQYQNNLDINEIIKVETLPKIFYQLEEIGKRVDIALNGIEDMVCDEENKKEVKKRKQEITSFKNMMEDRRIQIKKQIMEKYNEFNDKYESEIKTKLVDAENILNEKVSTIENQQKLNKENELRAFAEQWFISKGIENIVKFEDIKLNITLTASIKSLKEQVVDFVDRIFNDIKLIELEEYKDEIMFEYKQTLDFADSKFIVITRHKLIEEERQKREAIREQMDSLEKTIEKVDEIIAPQEIEVTTVQDTEEIYTVSFTVKATKSKLKELKEFLNKNEYNYE